MRKDVKCPYCGYEQNIDHDDGQGYAEDEIHQQTCRDCDKTFVFTTSISFYYDVSKADCLNGGDHEFTMTHTYPKQATRMRCSVCEAEREPTDDEWKEILK